MPTSKAISKITVTFEDCSVTAVDPTTGHSVILLLDCGNDVASVVSGKVSALVKLYWAIGQEYPQLLRYLASIRKDTESFRDQPVGETA